MKYSWNVVRISLALGACASFLTACQDQGGFQSATFSKDQIKTFCSKPANVSTCVKNGLMPKPANSTPAAPMDAAAVQQTQANPNSKGQPAAPAAAAATINPTEESPFKPTKGPEDKVFSEIADRDDLLARNEKALATTSDDAAKLVQGITITISGSASSLLVNIDAIVKIGNDARFLFVKDAPLAYNKDGKVTSLEAVLQENIDSPALPASDAILVSAVCKDSDCNEVQVRMEFKVQGGIVPAVFALTKSSGYDITQGKTNLGDALKSFDQARGALTATGPAAQASGPVAQASGPVAQASGPVAQATGPAIQTSSPVAQATTQNQTFKQMVAARKAVDAKKALAAKAGPAAAPAASAGAASGSSAAPSAAANGGAQFNAAVAKLKSVPAKPLFPLAPVTSPLLAPKAVTPAQPQTFSQAVQALKTKSDNTAIQNALKTKPATTSPAAPTTPPAVQAKPTTVTPPSAPASAPATNGSAASASPTAPTAPAQQPTLNLPSLQTTSPLLNIQAPGKASATPALTFSQAVKAQQDKSNANLFSGGTTTPPSLTIQVAQKAVTDSTKPTTSAPSTVAPLVSASAATSAILSAGATTN